MGIPFAEQGNLTGNLAALQELLFIMLLGIVGAVSDKLGRKSVYVFGLLTTAIGFALYPTAGSVAELVVYRIVIAVGSAAMLGMMVTVIADYSVNETRGKANGVQGFVATLGAFIPPILSSMPARFVAAGHSELEAQQLTFAIAAGMGVAAGIVAIVGLAPRATHAVATARDSVARILIDGAKAARDKGIALSYGAAFISRGDLAVTGAFLGLWLIQYGMRQHGMTPSEAMAALVMPSILAVVAGALIGSLLMGIVTDRITRAGRRAFGQRHGGGGLHEHILCRRPDRRLGQGPVVSNGCRRNQRICQQPGTGRSASRSGTPRRHHGIFGVAGAFGILIATKGGGMLFDGVGPAAPFVVFGALNLVVCLWGILVHREVQIPVQ